jgi:hypothetical protein
MFRDFWGNILPPFRGRRVRYAWKKSYVDLRRWTDRIGALNGPIQAKKTINMWQHVARKDWKAPSWLHNVTTQKTVIIIIITVRSSNLSIK